MKIQGQDNVEGKWLYGLLEKTLKVLQLQGLPIDSDSRTMWESYCDQRPLLSTSVNTA